jgi:hypothetical protein
MHTHLRWPLQQAAERGLQLEAVGKQLLPPKDVEPQARTAWCGGSVVL